MGKRTLFKSKKQLRMKTKITSLFISFIATFGFYSCDTDVENMEIQKLKTYDEQYFQNLRDFKKSDHEIIRMLRSWISEIQAIICMTDSKNLEELKGKWEDKKC